MILISGQTGKSPAGKRRPANRSGKTREALSRASGAISFKSMLKHEAGFAAMDRDGVVAGATAAATDATLAASMAATVSDLRTTFNTGRTKSLLWRRQQLQQLRLLLNENHNEITEAVRRDHANSYKARGLAEIKFAAEEISMALANLELWQDSLFLFLFFLLLPLCLHSLSLSLAPLSICSPY